MARWQLVAILVVVGALTALKLPNGFIYDDLRVIVLGDRIHDVGNLPGILLHNAMWTTQGVGGGSTTDLSQLDTWRPLTMATFVWDAAISGREPWSYHLTNLFGHLGVVALVWWVGRLLAAPERRGQVGWAALLFGLHPVGAEAHVWINGRSDLLAALCGVASLGARIWGLRGAGRRRLMGWVGSGVLLGLGCLCKEVLVMTAPLYPLAAWLGPRVEAGGGGRWGLAWRLGLVPGVAVGLYLPARVWVLSGLKASEGGGQVVEALARVPWLVLEGLGAALVPRAVYFRHTFEEFAQVPGWGLALAGVALGGVGALLWRGRRRWPLGAWSLVGFGLVLAPAAVITLAEGWWGFNRYLYLPLALLALALGDGLGRLEGWLEAQGRGEVRRWVAWGLGGYAVLEASLYVGAILDLRDEGTFYKAIIAAAPESSHGHYGLGLLLLNARRYEEAAVELRTAYRLSPNDARGRTNLLIALVESGALVEARQIGAESVAQWPDNPMFYNLTGMAWLEERPEEAARWFLAGLKVSPEDRFLRANLARVPASAP